MIDKQKVLKLCVPFQTKETSDEDGIEITGRASTNSEDRMGDIIVSDAWNQSGALANYLKNPIILAFHDMSRPIGKAIAHEVDEKGLTITAKISSAASDIVQLIKEGILAAFSVGFVIKDAEFDPQSGIFIIKEVELFEVSVVSVPANQDALFSIEKNFSNDNDYKEFKNQFIKSESEETLMVDKTKDDDKSNTQVIDVAALAAEIAATVKGEMNAETKAKEEADKKAKEAREAVEITATSAAERLVKDLKAELEEKDKTLTEALQGLHEAVKQQKETGDLEKELSSSKPNKMKFLEANKDTPFAGLTTAQKDGMLYAAKAKGIPITETQLFQDFAKKSNMEHWDPGVTGEWEDEYNTRIENAMREDLVVEPIFTSIPMSAPTVNMPINPEAGDATWVHSSAYRSSRNPSDETGDGSDTSTGSAVNHQLDEQTLIAYKLATREYIGYEEEEDSIVALAPVINDAIARRMSKTADLAVLRGAGVLTNTGAYDPILGLEGRGAGTTDVTVAGAAGWEANVTEDDVVDMRRNLGIYGLNPNELVLLVSHDYYYELMKLPNFKTVDVLADRATIITGQVGSLFGVRVVISQQFNNTAITAGTVGTTLAIMVKPSNFLIGTHRGLMTESDRDVINQKRVIVSSRRFAFQDIITGEATVNLQIAA